MIIGVQANYAELLQASRIKRVLIEKEVLR
jgi:hypothetical protein